MTAVAAASFQKSSRLFRRFGLDTPFLGARYHHRSVEHFLDDWLSVLVMDFLSE